MYLLDPKITMQEGQKMCVEALNYSPMDSVMHLLGGRIDVPFISFLYLVIASSLLKSDRHCI